MRIICKKDDLQEAVNVVQKAVSTKSTMAILEGILIETINDKIRLTGTDVDITIEYELDADIQRSGRIILNSKTFCEIVRKLPNTDVLIEKTEQNIILIEALNSKFKINCIPDDGFPEIVKTNPIYTQKVNQGIIKDIIHRTIFAISHDEKNKTLTGSLFDFEKDKLTVVSIDGYRMAICSTKLANENENCKIIVPGKTLGEIGKILTSSEKEVEIISSKKQIIFKTENCKIYSKLIGQDYVDYKNYIPKDIRTRVIINKSEILSALERSMIIIQEEKKHPVKFKVDNDKMLISLNAEIGNLNDEIYPDIEGENIEISFNPRYYIESLKVINDEKIKISFTECNGPCVITSVENEDYIYMILPVRT